MRNNWLSMRLFLQIMVLATLAMPASVANAQGTMGAVPDPISSRELDLYAERLGLSKHQRQAIDSLHDQYRAEFNQLREGDIQKFLEENRNMGGMGGMGMMMDRKAVEKSLKDLDDINGKIKTIDNRFFDQLQTVLAEDQMTRMPTARQARERVRYRSGLSRLASFMNPATQIDLSEIISDLNLSPQEKEAIEPLVMQYESLLTSSSRKLFEGTTNMALDGLKQLEQQGMTEEVMRDPQRRGQMFQAMRTIMGDMQRKLAERAGDISDLNRRSLRNITTSLSAEQSRKLRDQFYQRGYPEVSAGNRGSGSAARAFDTVLKFNELSDEQREVINTLATEYFSNLDRYCEQAMDLIDENRKTQSIFDFDQEGRQKFQDQIAALRDKRTKLNESSLESLRAVLGGPESEMVARLDKRMQEGGESESLMTSEAVMIVTGAPGAGGAVSVARFEGSANIGGEEPSDPFLPQAISKHDLANYGARLNASSDEKAVLNSLHEDYRERYKSLETDGGAIQAVRQAEHQLWAVDANTGQMTPQSPQAIDNLYSLRKKAMEAIVALDHQFFEDVQIAVGDDDLAVIERLKTTRHRELLARAGGGSGSAFFGMPGSGRAQRGGGRQAMRFTGAGGGGGEATVDISTVVNSLELSPSDPKQFDEMMLEYETAALAAFQKLYDSTLRMGAARDKMIAQSVRNEGDRQARTIQMTGDGMRGVMENEGRAANEARGTVTLLNKTTLPRLMSGLSPGDAQQLRHAYYEKAFPDVFRDSRSTEPHLKAAMSLNSLSSTQRAAVQELSMEFHRQYDQLCEKLIELQAAAPDLSNMQFGGGGGGGWQNIQEQMQLREKIEFDRNDLNDKTLARLRAALTEQQIRELGGLETKDD